MIIGVTGTTKVGKSTFINDFKSKFNKYTTPEGSYRDIPNLDLYEKGTEESQRLIRDYMFNQIKEVWSKRDTKRHVIMDRTLLDNLACTLVLYAKGGISDEFVEESFKITKKAMGMYHLVHFIPIDDLENIEVPDNIDEDYRMSVDVVLKTFYNAYSNRDDLAKDFLPDDKCAAIDQLMGSREERLAMASEILDDNGDVLGGFNVESTPVLYDQDGMGMNMGQEDAAIKLEDFGFTDEEIQKEKNRL